MLSVKPSPTRHSRIAHARRRSEKIRPVLAAIGISGLIFLCVSVALHWHEIRSVFSPLDNATNNVVCIYDRYDKLVCVMSGNEERLPVTLHNISPFMQQAVIASEDRAFYRHHGIDIVSIIRASIADVKSGKVVQGGSTITQQLAKNIYSKGAPRDIWQKIKETFIAWQLENNNSKGKILESYLNLIYFGRNAYGIERAAQEYFGKSAARLNLEESAFLAGLINSPTRLGNAKNLDDAMRRRSAVLDSMLECKFISSVQSGKAKSAQLHFRKSNVRISDYLYYVDAVMDVLKKDFGQDAGNNQGLNVYTNLDLAAQHSAVVALNKGIARAPKGVNQGALVSISVPDAAVIALVGGVGDYWKHQWNRVTSPHTVGSSFKPFVYLAGIINGTLTPHSILSDEPITVFTPGSPPYSPRNFDHNFMGPLTVREALAKSRNVCAVQVIANAGIDNVIKVAKDAGITASMYPGVSLALGSCAVSPLEMAAAYSTFARGGVVMQPVLIRKVTDINGGVLRESRRNAIRVFDKEPVAQLVDIMQDAVERGTGMAARIPGRQVAGKTGTSDQAKDVWFIGFTPDTVTATWGGNDQEKPIPGTRVTGGSVMAGIWHDYMLSYYKKHPIPPTRFPQPEQPFDSDYFGVFAGLDNGISEVEDAVKPMDKEIDKGVRKGKGFFGFMRHIVGLFH